MKIYEHRRWPLYTGYDKIYAKFGFDGMNYFAVLRQLCVLYIMIWISSFPMWLAYLLSDHKDLLPMSLNYDPFLDLIAKQDGRGYVWLGTIGMVILWNRFVLLQRKQYLDKSGAHAEVDRRSIIIMNVPKTVMTEDLTAALTESTHCRILQRLRTNSPQSLRYTKVLYKYHREYLDAMDELENTTLTAQEIDRYRRLRKWHVLGILQTLGYYRDQQFYLSRIERQKQRVKQATVNGEFETVILQLDSPESAGRAIHYLNGRHRPQKYACHAIMAPAPDDVYLENLEYAPVKRVFRFVLTFSLVFATSVLLFGLVCLFRFKMRDLSSRKQTYKEEAVTYYGFFFLVYVSDWVLRPMLYITQSIEKHYCYTDREFFWMLKLYFYQVLNKFGIFYSRNFPAWQVGDATSFFSIFGFNTAWRNATNQGGSDAKFYAYIIVFGYNVLDLLIFAFYHAFFMLTAHTKREKVKALKNLPLRFASKYVYLLVALTFVLCFGHVVPTIAVILVFYFPIQSVVCRFIMLRLASENIKTDHLTVSFCGFVDLACLIAAFCVAQSYGQLGQGIPWLMAPLAVAILQGFIKTGIFDRVINSCLRLKTKYEPMEATGLVAEKPEKWFEVAPPPVSETDMCRLDVAIVQ